MVKRGVNIEYFRLTATIFVIILHVLGQGGILNAAAQGGNVYWTAWFLEIGAFCSVNCFALITGYVMVNKSISTKNIVSLWLRVIFYSIIISCVIFVLFPESISLKRIVVAIFPITGQQWWYISSYFLLFFTIPFLNAGINSVTQQYYRKMLVVILIGVCIISCILPIDAFNLNNGYSAVWLIVMYLFGAYIRKYDIPKKITALKSLLGFASVIGITFLSKFVVYYFTKKFLGEVMYDGKLISYTSITILLASVFLFLFFLNIDVNESGFMAKFLGFFYRASLGTYLIHTHPLIFDFVLKDAFASLAHLSPAVMVLGVVFGSIGILVMCSIIEALRDYLFKITRLEKISDVVDNKINSLYLKIFKTS